MTNLFIESLLNVPSPEIKEEFKGVEIMPEAGKTAIQCLKLDNDTDYLKISGKSFITGDFFFEYSIKEKNDCFQYVAESLGTWYK